MNQISNLPGKVKKNWWLDALLFLGGVLAILSGIYFLFLPTGGYQGGRNPFYNKVILFSRTTWEDIHTWTGILMVLIAIVHFIIHWRWITGTVKLVVSSMWRKTARPGLQVGINAMVDALVIFSFVFSAFSGTYFLFSAEKKKSTAISFLFSPYAWDKLHTWSSIVFVVSILVHLVLHWKWICKVTPRVFWTPDKKQLALQKNQ